MQPELFFVLIGSHSSSRPKNGTRPFTGGQNRESKPRSTKVSKRK